MTFARIATCLVLVLTIAAAEASQVPRAAKPIVGKIAAAAEDAHSDAVLILRDGEVLLERYSDGTRGKPIELMSATKSVVALGVGLLLTEGKLPSLDMKVADLYPQWRQGRKRDITVRMLLDHTSGLQNVPNAGLEIYPAPNSVELALAAELQTTPGEQFSYNNKAVNLLAGVIHKAAGEPMDGYLRRRMFTPLGIEPADWYKDAAGVPGGMAGLGLNARDAAKLGQLVLDGGKTPTGLEIIRKSFIDEMLAESSRSPRVGLLWWRVPEWSFLELSAAVVDRLRGNAVPREFVAALDGMLGKRFESREKVVSTLASAIGVPYIEARGVLDKHLTPNNISLEDLLTYRQGNVVAWSADGYLGQYIVIVPSKRLVAVRQIISRPDHRFPQDSFSSFPAMVVELAAAL